jgi:ferric-dicitrate binding protein FerR (iron transport regulator)
MEMDNLRIRPAWTKSKEEIWDEGFARLDEDCGTQMTRIGRIDTDKIRRWRVWVAYAAAVVFAVCLTGSLYTVTEETARGEHAVVQLPDHSTVTLNAESKLSYKPFVWFVSRKALLEGEACFEVKSGSRFSVQSDHNRVNVLGTIFNVYTRPGMYRVACLTGQVEVQAEGETIVLNPNMQIAFREQQFMLHSNIASSAVTGWIQGKFDFDNTPLAEVIAEVERQYDIEITPDYDPNLLYSGNFSKTVHPEETLEIIGKPFGITFKINN